MPRRLQAQALIAIAVLALAGLLALASGAHTWLRWVGLSAVTPCARLLAALRGERVADLEDAAPGRLLLDLIAEAAQDGGVEGVNCAGKHGLTPLMYASIIGSLGALVPPLMRAGAQPDLRSTSGETALHLASAGGNIEAVRALVHAHANLNTLNGAGATPLAAACQRGRAEVARLLVHVGVQRGMLVGWINAADEHGMTALLWACESGGVAETALMLVKGGAELDHVIYNADGSAGRTALDFALARVGGTSERGGGLEGAAVGSAGDAMPPEGFAGVVAAIRDRGGHTLAELMAVDCLERGCSVVGVMSKASAAADPRSKTGLLKPIEEIYDRGKSKRARDAAAIMQEPGKASGAGGAARSAPLRRSTGRRPSGARGPLPRRAPRPRPATLRRSSFSPRALRTGRAARP